MLSEIIESNQRNFGSSAAWVVDNGTTTWSEQFSLIGALETQFSQISQSRVGVLVEPTAACFAALAALDRLDCNVFLLDSLLDDSTLQQLATQFRLRFLVRGHTQSAGSVPWEFRSMNRDGETAATSSVTILTSGTSGTPKAVRHTWRTLSRPVRKTESSQRWLLTYRPQLYAGLQVVLQCFVNAGTVVVPSQNATPNEIAQQMLNRRVTHVSGTPSYLRRLVLFADRDTLARIPLVQLTLGGEIADQTLLDTLKQLYPTTRIVHIYATTELGRCFSVTDGQEGFPASYLGSSREEVQLKVEEGELCVRSTNAMLSYDSMANEAAASMDADQERWFRTGDLVEIRGDRVFFTGRNSDLINVGGNKVSPTAVEAIVRCVGKVADCRVYPKESSIAGQLVACDVVPMENADQQELLAEIRKACNQQLAAPQRPRFINVVDQLETTEAGKTKRTEAFD